MDEPMDRLPLNSDFLFRLQLDAGEVQEIGAGPIGDRRVVVIAGGEFAGPGLSGKVLPGGADWLLAASDGSLRLDVRLVLQAEDGQMIACSYYGVRHAPPEVAARMAAGEDVPPGSYYMRAALRFETGSGAHEWLNRLLAVAVGHRFPEGAVYDVYAVL